MAEESGGGAAAASSCTPASRAEQPRAPGPRSAVPSWPGRGLGSDASRSTPLQTSSGALALDFSGSGGSHGDTGSRFFGGAEGAIAISSAFLFLNDNVGPYVFIFSVL